jgi:hypothetical protein
LLPLSVVLLALSCQRSSRAWSDQAGEATLCLDGYDNAEMRDQLAKIGEATLCLDGYDNDVPKAVFVGEGEATLCLDGYDNSVCC